jgi:hypothetical protein
MWHPTLDSIESRPDTPWMRTTRRGGACHVGPGDTLGGDGCWCGEPFPHAWPGKDDGAPHPRSEGRAS